VYRFDFYLVGFVLFYFVGCVECFDYDVFVIVGDCVVGEFLGFYCIWGCGVGYVDY